MELETIPHVLACDVGNTSIHYADVQGEEVTEVHTLRLGQLAELGSRLAELWADMPDPKVIAASNVNPAGLRALEAAVADAIGQDVLSVGRDLSLPIETNMPHPERTGVDRLCAAAAAYDHLGVACVVADFGTAITIDCVSEEGVFLGGAIMPGLAMSARSLKEQTAQLPHVEPVSPDWVFGKDTRQAIVGGLVFGARGALRELVESYATELGHWPAVIITGGDAAVVCPVPAESSLVQARVDDLVLRGVAIAYYKSLLEADPSKP